MGVVRMVDFHLVSMFISLALRRLQQVRLPPPGSQTALRLFEIESTPALVSQLSSSHYYHHHRQRRPTAATCQPTTVTAADASVTKSGGGGGFNLSPNRGRRRARVELTEDQKQELREAFELFDADKKVRVGRRGGMGWLEVGGLPRPQLPAPPQRPHSTYAHTPAHTHG